MKKKLEEYREKKKHGSALFPFNLYPCTIPLDFPSVSLHWQESAEVIFIKKGTGQVQLGMEIFSANPGDIFFIPPGTLHALRGIGGKRMEYENLIFEVDFLGGGAADVCAGKYLVPLAAGRLVPAVSLTSGCEGYHEALDCLQETEALCEKRTVGYELGVKAEMLRLIFLLVRLYPEPVQGDSPDTERLKRVLYQIEKGYREPLSVAMTAQSLGWSSSHFMRWFKQMTGSSFIAYLNERRLAAAAEALRKSDDKILVIAESAGFQNLSNFNRQFKARYGVTPKEYRRS